MKPLLLYSIHIIIYSIEDAVGIPKYGTCRLSGGCRLNRKVPHYVLAVEIIHNWIHERKTCFIYWCTGMHVVVICHFIFFFVPYLSFFVPLWNLACETLDLVLFLFDLLCRIPFCCFRLRYFACETIGLVLFVFDLLYAICFCGLRLNLACEIHLLVVLSVFDLLCAISLSCLGLWNLACGIYVGLVLFIFDLLCVISLSGIRLLKFTCEMEDDVVFFPFDLHGLTMGRLSGMHGLFQVYLQVNAFPAKLIHNP